ncbi:MAG: MBL fold metallo-hydrolase [Candidatus Methylopumilus sp.]|jgi:metallo-beta-lactamase family protein|nr:MBL fold metallo-hydrolase [Candidatus Methylopumilus sp.]
MQLTFLGATGTVTGSRTLLESKGKRILIDCGLFQGLKQLRLKNWDAFPVEPSSIDAILLTHAHIDHSGYLPRLVKMGFSGRIYCTSGTHDLCQILLPDSAHLQEEEARYANQKGFSKHHPALPLYSQDDAQRALDLFQTVEFHELVDLGDGLQARFYSNAHILGSSCIHISDGDKSVLFSGDVGRSNDPLMRAPEIPPASDYLVIESTYGDRLHDPVNTLELLAQYIRETVQQGGILLIPVFAVGRAQEMLFYLHQLKQQGRIPHIPIYLNSPMAVDASEIFQLHCNEHRLNPQQCAEMFADVHMVNSIEQSQSLNHMRQPMILLAASGMASGGRVVHHIKAFAGNPRNTILFVGFQAAGTRGAAMVNGASEVKIHGEYIPIKARIASMTSLSAHADYVEILQWLKQFKQAPKLTFVTHGEPVAADAMRLHIEEQLKWQTCVPDYLQKVNLS